MHNRAAVGTAVSDDHEVPFQDSVPVTIGPPAGAGAAPLAIIQAVEVPFHEVPLPLLTTVLSPTSLHAVPLYCSVITPGVGSPPL